MRTKVFNNLLLFSLFGIALGFFGILYEGIMYGPKLLNTSPDGMLFWKSFTSTISPLGFYIPWDPLATIVLIILYFSTSKERPLLKKRLGWSAVLQITSLLLTLYILTQINFKRSFGDLDEYAVEIPFKVVLFNILSVCRIILAAIAIAFSFKSYIQTQTEKHIIKTAGI
jgi:hypothetical protein